MSRISTQNIPPSQEIKSPPFGVLSTETGGGLTDALEESIRVSGDGDLLRIMSPVVDDVGIVNLLLDARERGVSIRMLTTLSDRHGIKTKGWDASQCIETHDECTRILAKSGVSLRSPVTTPHGKMIVRNQDSAIFGSANLAQGSLRGHALEAAMLIDRPGVVNRLSGCFDSIWKASRFRMRHKAGTVILEESAVEQLHVPWDEEDSAAEDCGVFVSAPGVANGTKRLEEMIRQASSEICLVSLSLYDTCRMPGLHLALLDTLSRKIRVRAIVRQEHFAKEEAKGLYPDPSTIELLQNGMELLGYPGLHAKGLVVDDSWVSIQSANFNPYSLGSTLPECNIEFIVAGSTEHRAFENYAVWIKRIASEANRKFIL